MPHQDRLIDLQLRLTADVQSFWSALPIPDWTAPKAEPDGRWEPEHVEISRYLAGRTYEAAKDFCCSESVFIWCRPDVATYYLGGYLLNGVERLSDPSGYLGDFHITILRSFLAGDSLYRDVYQHILRNALPAVSIVGRYGELLSECQQNGPPAAWYEDTPWPEEPELIYRICTIWRSCDDLQAAKDALPPLTG